MIHHFKCQITCEFIQKLAPHEIFVFGSNEAGIHGAGAAFTALDFGAEIGVGFGLKGQTFAIPTKDKKLEVLPLENIAEYVDLFYSQIKTMTDKHFLVTAIGTGLAGYSARDIAPLFGRRFLDLEHVAMPQDFIGLLLYGEDGQPMTEEPQPEPAPEPEAPAAEEGDDNL